MTLVTAKTIISDKWLQNEKLKNNKQKTMKTTTPFSVVCINFEIYVFGGIKSASI